MADSQPKIEGDAAQTHQPRELAVLDEVSRMLAEATSLDDVKLIRDKAEAARTYARAARLGLDLQNRAAEVKLRAERRAGEFLASLNLRGGDRRSRGRQGAPGTLRLLDLGISRQQSKRWQCVATVPEQEFAEYLRAVKQLGREVTSAGLLRIARGESGRNAGKVVGRESAAQNAVVTDSVDTKSQDLIEELSNHCQLLASVLRPIYEGGELSLKRAERRVIGRLLKEMNALIKKLQ